MDARRWWLGVVAVACFAGCGGKDLRIVGSRDTGDAGAGGSDDAGGASVNVNGGRPGSENPRECDGLVIEGGATSCVPDAGNTSAPVFEEGLSDIIGVTADETTLYWVEYGSSDELGNFQNDGRLLARDFDAAETRVLSEGLPGAIGVGVTTTHTFVLLDRFYDGGKHLALGRAPLAGGDPEIVQLDGELDDYGQAWTRSFAHHGDIAYFSEGSHIYRIAPEDAAPSVFVDETAYNFAVGNDSLYFVSEAGTSRVPFATGLVENLDSQEVDSLQVGEDYLYGIDESTTNAAYLVRMPLEGGPWTRLPPKRTTVYTWQLQMRGNLFFHDLHFAGPWQLLQGSLSDPASAEVVLQLPQESPQRVWVGTLAGVFWTDGDKQIRTAPLAVE